MTEPAPDRKPRRIACSRCGAAFGCLNDGSGRCWCGEEPFRLPVPLPAEVGPFADCLCPDCIRIVASALEARGTGPEARR
ncbi:cysteine-rich CWC family protein [Prosthecomicrobium sp. N25]|uniref:cysteine-rich CWC family protein n=1 Tax=Prosthecomicrobium sp. N25 TaxID=3129254 RepID=UPI003077F5C7